MKRILRSPLLVFVVRLIIGAIFISYSAGKIAEPQVFAKEIINYQILPLVSVNIFALILPWVELICGIFLMCGIRLRASSALTGFLLLIFIIAISSAMVRGLNIKCGCSSGGGEMVGWQKLGEDFLYLLLCAWIYFFPSRKFGFETFILNEGYIPAKN